MTVHFVHCLFQSTSRGHQVKLGKGKYRPDVLHTMPNDATEDTVNGKNYTQAQK